MNTKIGPNQFNQINVGQTSEEPKVQQQSGDALYQQGKLAAAIGG